MVAEFQLSGGQKSARRRAPAGAAPKAAKPKSNGHGGNGHKPANRVAAELTPFGNEGDHTTLEEF